MPGPLSVRAWLTGMVGLFLLVALPATAIQPSQGRTFPRSPPADEPLPSPDKDRCLPSLVALRDIGPRRDDGEVEQKSIVLDLGGGVKLEMIRIPAGSFLMGSPEKEVGRYNDEGPRHKVTLTRAFYLGKYEVTQEQYHQVMGANPSYFSAVGKGKSEVAGMKTDRFPVEQVSWHKAESFCKALSRRDNKGRMFRLPTEAEWEYACRAGTTTPFHFGAKLNGKQANCKGRAPYGTEERGPYLKRTAEVGSYRANAWGLYDMHGNVWEWCSDWHDNDCYPDSAVRDPTGPEAGREKVVRGGAWHLDADLCRAAFRYRFAPEDTSAHVGFRVAFRPN